MHHRNLLRIGLIALAAAAVLITGCARKQTTWSSSSASSSSGGSNSGNQFVQASQSSSSSNTPRPQQTKRTQTVLGVGARERIAQQLRTEIGQSYLFSDAPPKKLDDIRSTLSPETTDRIKSSYYVVYWGVDTSRLPAGASNTILAYENADSPSPGSYVLMADGSVRRMTDDEFYAAPKAGPYPPKD